MNRFTAIGAALAGGTVALGALVASGLLTQEEAGAAHVYRQARVVNAPPALLTESLCDGVDNDHDGLVDEGFKVGDGCTTDRGNCAPRAGEPLNGIVVCADDRLASVCVRVASTGREPTAETCNLIDDDCDGDIDEDGVCDGGSR